MKKILIVSLIFLSSHWLSAEVAGNVLERYKNNVFVTTGIYSCINIARALYAGFSIIHCIDRDEVLVNHAQFIIPMYIKACSCLNPINYHVYHGNPASDLINIIANIKEPTTFLLNSYLPEVDHPEGLNSILQELEQIKNHPIKTHTILIEYIHHAGTPRFGNVTLESIKEKLLEINPNYRFRYEQGGHLSLEESALLVAYL